MPVLSIEINQLNWIKNRKFVVHWTQTVKVFWLVSKLYWLDYGKKSTGDVAWMRALLKIQLRCFGKYDLAYRMICGCADVWKMFVFMWSVPCHAVTFRSRFVCGEVWRRHIRRNRMVERDWCVSSALIWCECMFDTFHVTQSWADGRHENVFWCFQCSFELLTAEKSIDNSNTNIFLAQSTNKQMRMSKRIRNKNTCTM